MAEVFGTTDYPSDQITVEQGDTIAGSAAFSTDAGIVGHGDTVNGSATEGELESITSTSDARSMFGEDSELQEQIELAFLNGATEVHAVAVETTQSTETFSGVAEFTLETAPILNPELHDDVSITVTDTSESMAVDTNIVYGQPEQPSTENTVNINPNTGKAYADASSSYEITYEYGDYTSAIADVVDEEPRSVGVCTENVGVTNTLLSEMSDHATFFGFTHGYVGAEPDVDASSYDDAFDNRRLAVISSSRGYLDEAETNEARTVGAVAGKQAGQELGDSTTSEAVQGFASLRNDHGGSDIESLIENNVMPLADDGGIEIMKDTNTSTQQRFERIYLSEITDEVTELTHNISDSYIGQRSSDDALISMEDALESTYIELEEDNLLRDHALTVQRGASEFEADVDVGIAIVGVFDRIDVTISVGDVNRNLTEE